MKLAFVKSRILPAVLSKVPEAVLLALARVNLLIPYYHIVSDDEPAHIKHLYPHRSVSQFKQDLEFLLKRYRPISLQNLLECLAHGSEPREGTCLFTFDDGFSECFHVIAPLLLAKGVPAAFFLTTGFLDNVQMAHHNRISVLLEHLTSRRSEIEQSRIWDILSAPTPRKTDLKTALLALGCEQTHLVDEIAAALGCDLKQYLSTHKPYLSSEQVHALLRDGFAIGAHSLDHPNYADLALEEQLKQTTQSLRIIRERFALPYAAFAFPHGDRGVLPQVFSELYRQTELDISFGTEGIPRPGFPRHFQRVSMEYSSASAEAVLHRHYGRTLYKRLRNRRSARTPKLLLDSVSRARTIARGNI